eukprot:Ihof_evm2s51 gene=Ihof_evmTU2s51
MRRRKSSAVPLGLQELVLPGPLEAHFQVEHVIGQGAFSTVRVGKEKGTGKRVAIKFIDKKYAFSHMNLDSECRLLRRLGRHPNINAYQGLYQNDRYYMIVLEYMPGGELLDILIKRAEKSAQPYSEVQVAIMLRQIVSAVDHCHRHNIIHRDLKPENVLVSNEESLGAVGSLVGAPIKIADFGLATEFLDSVKLTDTCGTPSYMAPERISLQPYDVKSDIWSIGVIMYILISGSFPFYGKNQEDIRLSTLSSNMPEYGQEFRGVSPACLSLLKNGLLAKDPARRPTAAQLLNHPWMTGELASTAEIKGALTQLKRFNARRKFRAAVKALMAGNRLKGMLMVMRSEQVVLELVEYSIGVEDVFNLNKLFLCATKGAHIASREVFGRCVNEILQIPQEDLVHRLFNTFQDAQLVNTREFCLSIATKLGANEDQTLELIFELFDSNENATIDQDEYVFMITKMLVFLGNNNLPNGVWLQQEFEEADTDKSGGISKTEFICAAKKNIKIQQYLHNVGKMLEYKNIMLREKIKLLKQNKQGSLFIRKKSKGFMGNLKGGGPFEERWVVIRGDNRVMHWYKTAQECMDTALPSATFNLESFTLRSGK